MTYKESIEKAKQGKTLMLPNFIGYFKWDYNTSSLIFQNQDYECLADTLNIQNRNDFYYIL